MPNSTAPNLADIRQEYTVGELNESDVSPDAFEQFSRWFNDAANLPEPTAMTLATADASGRPSARIVLLKGFDRDGFLFFTNYQSKKGRDLAANPLASLVFFWQPLERQIRIDGRIEKVARADSEIYFHSRPRLSQISAWISHQSSVVKSKEQLTQLLAEQTEKFAGAEVPLPDHWGGYRVIPEQIEFWQGRRSRLHDRLLYTRQNSGWKIERLAP